MQLKLVFVIVDKVKAEKVLRALEEKGLRHLHAMPGTGTAPSALSELFGVDDLTTVDAESFRKRREMLLLLADVTDRNAYDARVFYDRDLEDTVFFSNLSELSSSFDDFLSDEVIKGRKKCREYRMERILPSLSTYDDVKVFVSRWKESIIERIENK